MADFYKILKEAISDTGAASAAQRQMLYQRARAALDKQMDNLDPPLPAQARQAQYDRLGDAIEMLEQEAGAPVAGSARVEDVPLPPGRKPAPRKSQVVKPIARREEEVARVSAPEPAADEQFVDPGAAKGGKKIAIAAAALALLALIVGVAAYFALPSGAARNDAQPIASAPQPAEAAPEPTAPALVEPAEPPAQSAQAPDVTPAPADPVTPAVQPAGEPVPPKDQERVPQDGVTASGERALFVIEESEGVTPPERRFEGSATWALTGEGDDATLVFSAAIPERSANFEMTMRKNGDASLPASHIIEFIYSATGGGGEGQVSSIPGMLMRNDENEAGIPLRGAGAQIVPGQYLIGLSNSEADISHNLGALQAGNWIAVPALLDNNKRALFLVAKGTSGMDAVKRALAAWGQTQQTQP